MASLAPRLWRGRVEDVVVDSAARGQGVASLLIQQALSIAEKAGARTVDLTSHPDRGAANRLYERLGFRVRHSTVYRQEGTGLSRTAPTSDTNS
ncbi:GNAT family N-acetyltransferase [Streptomyces sp. NPDC003233]